MSIGPLSGFMQLSNFEALASGLDSVAQGVSATLAQTASIPLDQVIQSFAPPGLVPPAGLATLAGAAEFPSPANFLSAVAGTSPHLGAVRDILADPGFDPMAGLAQSLGGVFDGGLLNRLIGQDGLLNPLLGGLSLVTPGAGDLSGGDAVGRRTLPGGLDEVGRRAMPDGLEEVGRRTLPDGLEEVGRRTLPGGLDEVGRRAMPDGLEEVGRRTLPDGLEEVGRRTLPGGLDEVGRRAMPGDAGDSSPAGVIGDTGLPSLLSGLDDTLRDVAGLRDMRSAEGLDTLGRLREQLGTLDRLETGVRDLCGLKQSLDGNRLDGGK